MMRALYSSVAGLKTHQTKMDVIGNNIANVNTVGFKSSRTTFSTMMYQNLSFASGANNETGKGGVNAKQIGLGTTFASTAIDIDTGGASESTGKAFDLKLSDKNSTSFYIVNTGTENVFTRAGAFYVDGAGNLCMESTGYMVMGWQVDANGNIQKDTVTPLKIMSTDNQTSNPEYTTNGVCSGILDDNSANVNSDEGYRMNLIFYDNLGYAYTAMFAAQKTGEDGEYTVNLTDIRDSNGRSIFTAEADVGLADLFGGGQGSNIKVTDNYKIASGMGNTLTKLANDIKTNATAPAAGGTASTPMQYNFTSEYLNELFSTSKADQLDPGLRVQISVTYDDKGVLVPLVKGGDSIKVFSSDGAPYTGSMPDWMYDIIPATGTDPAKPDKDFVHPSKVHTVQDDIKEMVQRGNLSEKEITTPPATAGGASTTATYYVLSASKAQELYREYNAQDSSLFTGGSHVNGEILFLKDGTDISFAKVFNSNGGELTGTTDGTLDAFAKKLVAANYTDTLEKHLGDGYVELSTTEINNAGVFTSDLPKDVEVRYKYGEGGAWSYDIVTPGADGYKMQFSTADGSLTYIGSEGNTTQTLRLSNFMGEGNPFSDIEIDFSTLKNLSNGGSSTAAMANGDSAGDGAGKRVGTLIGLSVDQSGKIYGSYSNGNTSLLGQIAVARFGNASGLESIGDNCYRTTMNSGQFDGIGVEMDSDGSTIDSGTLEMSNVDLATEFTQMITTQRGYQANSRVISTSDGILEELVNLKR